MNINKKSDRDHVHFLNRPHTQATSRIPHTDASPLNILLIEDNESDVYLARKAFKSSTAPVNLFVLSKSEDVLPFLREETPHDVSFKPDLIVLDLYLTTHDGLFLLNALKQDPQVLSIPVVVLTNSIRFDDLRDCYQHHVAGFIRKPLDYSSFEKRMHALVEYWANTVELPHHQHTT